MYNSPERQPLPPPPPFYTNPAPSYPPAAAVTQPVDDARAKGAGVALLLAAGLVLLATLTKSWFTAGHGEGGVGLLGLESCRGAICKSLSWFDVKRIPAQIPIFATTALIACLVLVAFMVHSGVMLLQSRPQAVQLRWLSQVLGLASFGITAFVFSLSIGDWSRGLSLGWSTFVGLAGVIAAGVIAGAVVRPLTRA